MLDEPRRSEIRQLHDLILATAPGLKISMWSVGIGYGSYHYHYASGREGDWPPLALSSRKQYIALYASCVSDDGEYIAEKYKKDLPKADIGKSCIRFKHLTDVDLEIIKKIIIESATRDGKTYDGTKKPGSD